MGLCRACLSMSLPTAQRPSSLPQNDQTKGRICWGSRHLTVLLQLSVLERGGSSVASHPTELRGTGAFLASFFWTGGDSGASLDLGKRTSWSLIIMVITLWIWGVPEGKKRFGVLVHGPGAWQHSRVATLREDVTTGLICTSGNPS